MHKLLFVCTGNICRSPTAEGVMRHLVKERGIEDKFHLDSAGIQAYHVGEAPDTRSTATAKKRGIAMHELRARKVTLEDYNEFDYIFAMDKSHYHWLTILQPKGSKAKVHMYLDFCDIAHTKEVPDPYYGKQDGFEEVLDLIEEASRNLLIKLDPDRL